MSTYLIASLCILLRSVSSPGLFLRRNSPRGTRSNRTPNPRWDISKNHSAETTHAQPLLSHSAGLRHDLRSICQLATIPCTRPRSTAGNILFYFLSVSLLSKHCCVYYVINCFNFSVVVFGYFRDSCGQTTWLPSSVTLTCLAIREAKISTWYVLFYRRYCKWLTFCLFLCSIYIYFFVLVLLQMTNILLFFCLLFRLITVIPMLPCLSNLY